MLIWKEITWKKNEKVKEYDTYKWFGAQHNYLILITYLMPVVLCSGRHVYATCLRSSPSIFFHNKKPKSNAKFNNKEHHNLIYTIFCQ